MDWKAEILAFARDRNRSVLPNAMGIGIPYADGADVFWILPGEPMSTLAIPPEGPGDVGELLAKFECIDRVRSEVIHVITHDFADRHWPLERNASGDWKRWVSGHWDVVNVGQRLTHAIIKAEGDASLDDLITEIYAWNHIERPSSAEVEALVKRDGPVDGPAYVEPPQVTEPLLESGDFNPALLRQWLLRRVGERSATGAGGTNQRGLSLKFRDREAEYVIAFDLSFQERIATRGLVQVVDEVADDFLRLDRDRGLVIRAIWRVAAARGWKRTYLIRVGRQAGFLGATSCEVRIEVGDLLTERLRRQTPSESLAEMLADTPDFLEACLSALADGVETYVEPPEFEFLAPPPEAPLPLLKLTQDRIAAMNARCDEALNRFFADDASLYKFDDDNYYDPRVDSAFLPRWVELARRAPTSFGPLGAVALLRLGAETDLAEVERFVRSADPHDEMNNDELEAVWWARGGLPCEARKWFGHEVADYVGDIDYDPIRARLGDPTAAYRVAARVEDADPDDYYVLKPDEVVWLSPARLAGLHERLVDWARTAHVFPDLWRLSLAARLGWRDVMDALEANPYLSRQLLTADERALSEMPAILYFGDDLLAWSRIGPSRFLARLLLTAASIDLVGVAAMRRSTPADSKDALENHLSSCRQLASQLDIAIAFAWTRCLPQIQ